MEKTGVAARLRELATGNEQRKEVAKLRAVFDDVEAALAAGVKRTAILEVLREGGLKMSQGTFDTQVYRIRKSRKARVAGAASAPADKPDAGPEPAQADAAKAPAADAPPAQVAPDTGTQAPVRLPDIQQSQEKARRYISGPLDFDVDNLIKKGNQ